jgi:hypothetical protein
MQHQLADYRPNANLALVLNGWLDVDIISSTRIFSELERHEVYTLAELIQAYFEQKILGAGALRTNETPDGWMCGFLSGKDAIHAALELVINLDLELNEKLRKDHSKIFMHTADGIGIRVGVNVERLVMKADQKLGDVAEDPLNHTGHLQKKSGIEFIKYLQTTWSEFTFSEDMLAWTLSMSSTAQSIFNGLSSTKVIEEFRRQTSSAIEVTIDKKCYIFGSIKKSIATGITIGSKAYSNSIRS